MISKIVVAIICLIAGIWQISRTRRYLQHIKLEGDENTSPFAPVALYFGYLWGAMFIIIGCSLLLNFSLTV